MTAPLRNKDVFSDFSLWVNAHPQLGSSPNSAALTFTDLDAVFHRYMTFVDGLGTRDLQCLMIVETKTKNAKLTRAQSDTLEIVDQLTRTTSWKSQRSEGQFITGHSQNTRRVRSIMNGRRIELVCFGVHNLIMSGTSPENSGIMLWDDKHVTADQLVKLFRFEIHPDSLKPWKPRRHKKRTDFPLYAADA